MASQDGMEIYRDYSGDALATELNSLRGQLSIFSSQNLGSKSFTRDLQELRSRLHTATRVATEKGAC